MCVCLSVRLSVTLQYCIKIKKASVMISSHRRRARNSSFWKYLVHHEIRKGSPRARAIYETRVGKIGNNFADFSTNKPPYLRNGARLDQGCYWSLIYRKSHTRFRLVPKSTTLDDPELNWPWTAICALIHYTHVYRSPPQKFEWR